LAFDPQGLSTLDSDDRQILLNAIRGSLLALETLRTFEKDPDTYPSGAGNGVYLIMSRHFASPDDRLRSVIARELQFPRFFADARANPKPFKKVPRIYAEIALEQPPGTIGFFARDVPAAFADATDPEAKAAFAKSNAATLNPLREYQDWLESEVLP